MVFFKVYKLETEVFRDENSEKVYLLTYILTCLFPYLFLLPIYKVRKPLRRYILLILVSEASVC